MKKIIRTLLIVPVLLLSLQVFGSYIITPFNYEWCSTTYPTNYVSANFSITETAISGSEGFTKNQMNKTLVITLPAGLEFKTTATTASVTVNQVISPEVVIDSFKFNSVTQFTVWITTSGVNVDYNTIYFNNFEIRAINSFKSLTMIRGVSPNNGTFKIDNATSNPPASNPFGTFSSKAPYTYLSSAVTQLLTTTDINQFSINNPILSIKINGSGNCGSQITQFNFSAAGTDGTDSLRNISQAKVYYSTSSVFNYSTASLFGSVSNLSSMNFSVTGTYNTNVSTIYFYLCYDVPGDAYTDNDGNRLDASLISFVMNGVPITNMSTPSPAGCRKVVPAAYYYSKISGNWTDNIWSIIAEGPLCNCQPNGAGIVYIDTGNSVLVDKTRKVDVLNIMKDASLEGGNANMNFYVNTELNTYDNGYTTFLGDFILRGNLNIYGTGISWFHKVDSVGGNVYIGPDATLMNFASSTFDMAICGNLTVDGYLQNEHASIDMYNTSKIDGTGIIRTDFLRIRDGNKTVNPTADLYIDAGVTFKGPYIIDNFGKMNIRGNMDADSNGAHWINEPGSVLSYGGSATMFATHGYLVASSNYNTVRYSGLTDQIIIGPENLIYYNIVLEGSGIKTLQMDTHLHGDFTFNAGFGHFKKTITVDGAVRQYFSETISPKLYGLTMSNAQNGLTLQLPVKYNQQLTLLSGKIFTTMTNILIATDSATATSGSDISFVNGPMRKVGNDAFVYPVGKDDIWARIGISAPQTFVAAFTAEYFNFSYINTSAVTLPIHNVSSVEYWNLLQDAKAGDSVKVKLYWENASRSYIYNYTNDLVVAGWSGTSWLNRGQSAITASNPGNITSNFVRSFGPFTFGSINGNNPLPMTLLNFDAKSNSDHIAITWATISENNNEYFTVEKSKDATNFEPVGIVKGAGNSNELLQYSLNDYSPFAGVSYYRLKQTDFDGKFTYSDMVAVDFNNADEFAVYPNPFKTSLTFEMNEALLAGQAELRIYNTMGKEEIVTSIGNGITTIETGNIPSGLYYYNVLVNNKIIQSGKLVSQNK